MGHMKCTIYCNLSPLISPQIVSVCGMTQKSRRLQVVTLGVLEGLLQWSIALVDTAGYVKNWSPDLVIRAWSGWLYPPLKAALNTCLYCVTFENVTGTVTWRVGVTLQSHSSADGKDNSPAMLRCWREERNEISKLSKVQQVFVSHWLSIVRLLHRPNPKFRRLLISQKRSFTLNQKFDQNILNRRP